MTLDGFLTFLALIVASYAVLGEVVRLRLGLHATRAWWITIPALLLVLALLLLDDIWHLLPLGFQCLMLKWRESFIALGLDQRKLAFLIVLLWALLVFALYRTARPNGFALGKLKRLSDQLLDEGRYLELCDIVLPYCGVIRRATTKSLPLQRLHYRLAGYGLPDVSMHLDAPDRTLPGGALKSLLIRFVRLLSFLVPSRSNSTAAATSIERSLLSSRGLLRVLTRLRPDFTLELMKFSRWEVEVFVRSLIEEMMADKESRFYGEIEALDTKDGSGDFAKLDGAPLFGALASDPRLAVRHGIWKPIGDSALQIIREDSGYRAELLMPPPEDENLFRDPVFCSLAFFRDMVRCAALNDTEDHMWLMYMTPIARALADATLLTNAQGLGAEFPTLSHRLIYEAISNLRDWISLYDRLDKSNVHAANLDGEFEEFSIIQLATREYVRVMGVVAVCSGLTDTFKVDRWEGYVREIDALPNDAQGSSLRRMLLSITEPGGLTGNADVALAVRLLNDRIDPLLRQVVQFEKKT